MATRGTTARENVEIETYKVVIISLEMENSRLQSAVRSNAEVISILELDFRVGKT